MRLVAILRWPAFLAGLIVLYLYLIFVLCPRVAAAEPTNGLANPGFENGLESWTEPFFGSPFGLSSTTFHGGILAAAQTVPLGGNASQDYWSEIYQNLPIAPGQPVTFSGYVRTSFAPAATNRAGLMLQFFDANGLALGEPIKSPAVGGATAWRLVAVSSSAAPAGAVSVRATLYIWAGIGDLLANTGEVDFDDFVVAFRYQQPTPSTTLSNPGFENGVSDWDMQYGAPFLADASTVFAGAYSATNRVSGSVLAERNYWSEIYQIVKVAAGQPVHLKAYIRTTFPIPATAKAGLLAQYLDASGDVLATVKSPSVGGTSDWRLVELSRGSAPAGSVTVRLSAYVWAQQNDTASTSGAAFFDEMVFEKKSVPAVLPAVYVNPGFESGLHDWLQNAGFSFKLESAVRQQGSYGVSNALDPLLMNAKPYFADIHQLLKPAGPIYASGWVKTTFPIAASAKAGIMIEFLDSAGKMIGSSRQPIPVGGTTDWRLLEVFASAAPTGTAKVRVGGFLWAAKNDALSLQGKAYFDSMSVERVVRRPDLPGDFLNPGFETGLHDWLDQYGTSPVLQVGPAAGGTGIVRSGQYAAGKKITSVSVQDFYSQGSQVFSAAKLKAAGKKWAVIHARTTFKAGSSARAGLQVQFLNSSNGIISQRKVQIGDTKNWTPLFVSLNTMPAGTYAVRVMSYVYAAKGNTASVGGWAYFDDAATTTVKEAPPSALVGTLDEPAPLAGMPGSDEFVEEE